MNHQNKDFEDGRLWYFGFRKIVHSYLFICIHVLLCSFWNNWCALICMSLDGKHQTREWLQQARYFFWVFITCDSCVYLLNPWKRLLLNIYQTSIKHLLDPFKPHWLPSKTSYHHHFSPSVTVPLPSRLRFLRGRLQVGEEVVDQQLKILWLVGGLAHVLFSHILGTIIPID